ncbi:hypothetical protein LTR08_003657 [Meristemomyces frigidus]|nr:hypothetical protein LTR08_003657 [Meristemomyces frigidus]
MQMISPGHKLTFGGAASITAGDDVADGWGKKTPEKNMAPDENLALQVVPKNVINMPERLVRSAGLKEVKPGKKKVAASATAQSEANDSVLGEAPIDRHNAEVAADIEAKRQKYSKKRAAPQSAPEIDAPSTSNNEERSAQTPEGTTSPAKKLG